MAKTAQKVTLSPSRDIPFDKLVLSQSNVRRIKASISVEELAEDIARRGLLQSLSVRPVLADDGSETGKFEIPAGGRRFQALSLLVKQKRLAKTTPIPCIVRDAKSAILAEDDSLAENMQRAAQHPLHQFRAFVALREKGQGDEEIAAAFCVTPQVVKQRLKLAAVAPALLELYVEDEMTLEQLMAFTVNPDHERQVQVWEAIRSSWNKEPYYIRRMLMKTSVRASDRRAVFVGVEAYETAGGTMLHDLFQGDDGGWLEDPALLDRLVSKKLQAEAEAVATEGWKWIEVSLDLPYGYSHGLRRLSGDPAQMTVDEGAAHATLLAEYRVLEEEYEGQDEFPEEIDARLGELEVAMEKLEARPLIFDAEEIARAGAFVTLDRYGELAVYRGFVRPEDEPREDADVHSGEQAADRQGAELSAPSSADGVGHGTVIASVGQALATNVPYDEDDGALKPLPERLVMELTAHRTLALREAVGRSPDAAAPEARQRHLPDVQFGRQLHGGFLRGFIMIITATSLQALRVGWRTEFQNALGEAPSQRDRVKELQERVEAAYLKATEVVGPVENTPETKDQNSEKTQEMNPREVISDPHILITNQLGPVISNSSENEEVVAVVPNARPEDQVDSEPEEWVAELRKKRAALDLPTVMQACPEFASWARNMGGFLKDWGDLHRVAGQLRPMIGVSEHAWNVAQDRLSKQVATAALALVFEKHCAGEVSSPGGYLRGMVEKAGAGELHLERSFYGRLSGQAA